MPFRAPSAQASGSPPPPPPPPIAPNTPDISQLSPETPQQIDEASAPFVGVMVRHARALHHIVAGVASSEKGDQAYKIKSMPFVSAFGCVHDNDAHVCTYGVIRNGVEGTPTHQDFINDEVYRLSTYAPTSMHDAGWITSPDQVSGWGIIVECDNKDLGEFDGKPSIGKIKWSDERRRAFAEYWKKISAAMPILARPTCFFTTRNGFRLVYLFTRPIPVLGVGGHQDRYRGFMVGCYLNGLPVDKSTKDWTRLQRLGIVYREDSDALKKQITYEKTWESDYFRQSFGRVDVDSIEYQPQEQLVAYPPEYFTPVTELPKVTTYATHPQWHVIAALYTGIDAGILQGARISDTNCGSMPQQDEIQRILHGIEQNKPSEEHRRLRANIQRKTKPPTGQEPGPGHLAARRVQEVIWEGRRVDLNPDGTSSLHDNVMRLISDFCWINQQELGQAAGLISAQTIFAHIIGPARIANEARAGKEGYRSDDALQAEVWDLITWIVRRKLGEKEHKSIEQSAVEEEKRLGVGVDSEENKDKKNIIVQAIQQWLNVEIQWASENWRRFLLISSDYGISVLKLGSNGEPYYSRPAKDMKDWATHIASSNHDFIPLLKTDGDGNTTVNTATELMVSCGMHIGDNVKVSRLVKTNAIERVGSLSERDISDSIYIVCKMPGIRSDILPVHHPKIEEWICALAGAGAGYPDENTRVRVLKDWLAKYPDLNEPLQAIYLQSALKAGKGLMVDSLALLTERRFAADFADALGDFQDDFVLSPLMVIDEGASGGTHNFSKNVGEVLRRMIGGQGRKVSRKGRMNAHIDGHPRLVITANNDNVLRFGEDLSSTDMAAIEDRVIHLMANNEKCRDIFFKAGGRFGNEHGPGTEKEGWPLMLAQHIMWLNKNWAVERGDRFAIKGYKSGWHDDRRVQTNSGTIICLAVQKLLLLPEQARKGILYPITKGRENTRKPGLLCKPEEMHDKLSTLFSNDDSVKIPPYNTFQKNLTTLGEAGRFRTGNAEDGKVRGVLLDITSIIKTLHRMGRNIDFREALGDELWEATCPFELRQEVAEDRVGDKPATSEPAPRVVPFRRTR